MIRTSVCPPCPHRMAFPTCEESLWMGPICGVYFKLRGAPKKSVWERRTQTGSRDVWEQMKSCNVSQGNKEKQCRYMLGVNRYCNRGFLEKHYCIINTLLVEFKLCWSVQAGRQWSFRPACALYATIQSASANKAWTLTVRWNTLLPPCVTRTGNLPASLIEDRLLCPKAVWVLMIRLNMVLQQHKRQQVKYHSVLLEMFYFM